MQLILLHTCTVETIYTRLYFPPASHAWSTSNLRWAGTCKEEDTQRYSWWCTQAEGNIFDCVCREMYWLYSRYFYHRHRKLQGKSFCFLLELDSDYSVIWPPQAFQRDCLPLQCMFSGSFIIIISHLSLNWKGSLGFTGDFTTSFLHFSLFSTALWDLAHSRPVHSLMLSSHLFLCLWLTGLKTPAN